MRKFGLSLVGTSLVAPSAVAFAGSLREADLMKMSNEEIISSVFGHINCFFDSLVDLVKEGDDVSEYSKQKIIDVVEDLETLKNFCEKWRPQEINASEEELVNRLGRELLLRLNDEKFDDLRDVKLCKETEEFLEKEVQERFVKLLF